VFCVDIKASVNEALASELSFSDPKDLLRTLEKTEHSYNSSSGYRRT